MKDYRFKLILLTSLFFSTYIFAQHPRRCATTEYLEHKYSQHPGLRKQHQAFQQNISSVIARKKQLKTTSTTDTLVIPVVVHIIGNRSDLSIDGYTVTDEQVYSQIDALNRDYGRRNSDSTATPAVFKPVAADIKIKFCLATTDPNGNPSSGIIRVTSSRNSFGIYGSDESTMKSLSYWPSNLYMNLWVAKLNEPALGGTLLGYASFPNNSGLPGMEFEFTPEGLDGVAIHFRAFGTVGTLFTDFNLGRTTTHEVGHWLGLIHIWGNETSCSGTDHCNDTPPCADSYQGDDCNANSNICSATQRMIENYMDYSADACMNIFTMDQKDRMRTSMDVSPDRLALRNSFGCCAINAGDRIPVTEDFESNPINGSGWTSENFDANSPYTKFWHQASVGYKSNSSFSIDNDSIFVDSIGERYKDFLETPHFQLSGLKNVILEFDLSYAAQTSAGPTDSLVVMYNGGCAEEQWTVAGIYYGTSLTTAAATANFQPSSDTDWIRKQIVLNNLPNESFVKFRFADYSKGINPVYIDNINIYRTKAFLDMSVFPSPTSSMLRTEVFLPSTSDIKLDIFDCMGRNVLTMEKTSTTSFAEEFNVGVLSDGMYIIRVIAGDDKITKKFVVSQ